MAKKKTETDAGKPATTPPSKTEATATIIDGVATRTHAECAGKGCVDCKGLGFVRDQASAL